ncbi:hypothetical protein [Parasitella parasitica]|uniref:Uncharacterized protein n=1 Tax=Parasitella parasitica TaxID=35722 RepID=A0A0B7NWP9_9FUNG|nr:hypothetical protein [Parasitella parasitica]
MWLLVHTYAVSFHRRTGSYRSMYAGSCCQNRFVDYRALKPGSRESPTIEFIWNIFALVCRLSTFPTPSPPPSLTFSLPPAAESASMAFSAPVVSRLAVFDRAIHLVHSFSTSLLIHSFEPSTTGFHMPLETDQPITPTSPPPAKVLAYADDTWVTLRNPTEFVHLQSIVLKYILPGYLFSPAMVSPPVTTRLHRNLHDALDMPYAPAQLNELSMPSPPASVLGSEEGGLNLVVATLLIQSLATEVQPSHQLNFHQGRSRGSATCERQGSSSKIPTPL